MDKQTISIILAGTIVVCIVVIAAILITMAQYVPSFRKKTRIVNRKQFSRQKVEEELLHNVRYSAPESVSVSLAPIQPHSSRRQTLPAISLCQPSTPRDSPAHNGTTNYGSIELIRATVRRYSDVSFSRPDPNERSRKVSLDSKILSKICEESSEQYSKDSRRGSSLSFLDPDTGSELDLDQYSSTDEITAHSMATGCGLGRLYFVANFNRLLSNLYVTILKASYVRSSLIKETCCVYVKIGLLPADAKYPIHRTNYVTSMGNPMFNQTVKEVRKLESNRVIGYVWFDMSHLLKEDVSVNYNQEISREIFGENKLFHRRGDVLVNLKISIKEAIEINVLVAEARNLLSKNENNSIYVRVSLLIDHKVYQSKKGQTIKRGVSSPVFNDRFRFLLPETKDVRDLEQCCVILCFCYRSRVHISRLIGRCVIGPVVYTEGDGLMQWSEAISKPGTTASHWLTLT